MRSYSFALACHMNGLHDISGLDNKLLKPLAPRGPVDLKSYWPEKITGLNFRNQRRGLHTKHD